jgi:hypothetical protein
MAIRLGWALGGGALTAAYCRISKVRLGFLHHGAACVTQSFLHSGAPNHFFDRRARLKGDHDNIISDCVESHPLINTLSLRSRKVHIVCSVIELTLEIEILCRLQEAIMRVKHHHQ